MKNVIQYIVCFVLLLGAGSITWAQDAPEDAPGGDKPQVGEAKAPVKAPAKDAAKAPEKENGLNTVVVEISGRARYRVDEKADWQIIKKEDALPVGTEIQSGSRTKVTLQVGPNAKLIIGSFTNVTIAEMQVQGDKNDKAGQAIRTRIVKKYGAVHFDVHDVGFRNDFTIASPSGVMAVRGTSGWHSNFGGLPTVEGVRANGLNSIQLTDYQNRFVVFLSGNQKVGMRFSTPEKFRTFLLQFDPQQNRPQDGPNPNLDKNHFGSNVITGFQKQNSRNQSLKQFNSRLDNDSGGENQINAQYEYD